MDQITYYILNKLRGKKMSDQETKPDKLRLTGLWTKSGARGDFMTANLNTDKVAVLIDYLTENCCDGVCITIFPNNFKDEDKHPDYNMIIDTPYKQNNESSGPKSVPPAGSAAKTTGKSKTSRFKSSK